CLQFVGLALLCHLIRLLYYGSTAPDASLHVCMDMNHRYTKHLQGVPANQATEKDCPHPEERSLNDQASNSTDIYAQPPAHIPLGRASSLLRPSLRTIDLQKGKSQTRSG